MIDWSLVKVPFLILWTGLGIAAAFVYIEMIRRNANALDPNSQSPQVLLMILSMFVRIAAMGVLIYLAIRQHVVYGILFVIVFSITHFILLQRYARQMKASEAPKEAPLQPEKTAEKTEEEAKHG